MKALAERPLLFLLALVQFTHIVDFMILMPLGPQLMRDLHIGPGHFSALVAANTIRSGIVGLLTAPLRSEEHTSELQSPCNLVFRLLLVKKKPYATLYSARNY